MKERWVTRLAGEGVAPEQIARRLRLRTKHVRAALERAGVPRSEAASGARRKVRRMLAAGRSIAETVEATGMTWLNVSRLLDEIEDRRAAEEVEPPGIALRSKIYSSEELADCARSCQPVAKHEQRIAKIDNVPEPEMEEPPRPRAVRARSKDKRRGRVRRARPRRDPERAEGASP
jgi:hypothetical protein